MSAYGRGFWVSTAERALKTMGQTAASDLTLRIAGSAILDHRYPVPWQASVIGVLLATAFSIASSIGSAKIGPDNSASLVGEPPKVNDAPPPRPAMEFPADFSRTWHDDQVDHAKLIGAIDATDEEPYVPPAPRDS